MRKFLTFLSCFLILSALHARNRRGVYNDIAVDIPFDGGVMIMASRMWSLNNFLDVGLVGGGGQINRDFEIETTNGTKLDAHSQATIFPFIGPQLSFNFGWIGLAVGYAAFFADTDLTVDGGSLGTLTGSKKAWGSGFYSPLLVLDFYDKKHDLVFGLGLGGFLGTSYPNIEAQSATAKITTDESPIDTLTFHVRMMWADGRWQRMKEKRERETDF